MDKALEEARLAAVRALILEQINALSKDLKTRHGGVTEARRSMWAETHIIRDFDDVANLSTLLSDVQFHEQQYAGVRLRLANLKRMLESPYFGRVDFIEDGYPETEKIYIGSQSLFEEKKQAYLVYDWRAPISSMYYDYGVGRASFDAPDGSVTGEIIFKRQYRIEKGELVYLFDSDLKIDDDILQWELSKASDAKIKTIINSIQREQNRAIRSDADRLVVFGPAGSGKTSVGLHRLAYLLYKHRGGPAGLTSARVRIFSSNNIFSSYISGIIPELGEEDVVTLDFKTLLTDYAPEGRAFRGPYEQIEYLYRAAEDDARRACIAMKNDPSFTAYVADYIRRYTPAITEDACFNADVVCEKEKIADLYGDRTTAGNLATKTARTLDYVNRRYEEYFKENKKAVTAFFNDLYDENFHDGDIRRKYDEQKNIVLEDLRSRFFPDTKKLYEKIVRAYVREKKLDARISRVTSVNLRGDRLYYEDALLLLYMDILSGRIKKERNVRHILVDEAQDLSRVHHQILTGLFENCHFTVLADVNQALYPDINLHDKQALLEAYSGATVVELQKSYRSTFEISRFAAGLLGHFDDSAFYARMGGEPEVINTADAAKTVAELLTTLPADFHTVGILLPDKHGANAFYKQLTAHTAQPVHLIADADEEFEPGVMVIAVPYAKGLEFDAVIVPGYGGSCYDGAQGRRILYLMCTRALHRLYLLQDA